MRRKRLPQGKYMKKFVRTIVTLVAVVLVFQPVCAEFFGDEAGSFIFDLPDGFYLADSDPGKAAYSLKSALVPLDFVVRVYPPNEAQSAGDAMQNVLRNLNAQGTPAQFMWLGQVCVIAQIFMQPQGYAEKQSGWALTAVLPETGDTIAAIVFSSERAAPGLQKFMLSVLDSLYIDEESWLEAGPVTAFAYPDVGQKKVTLNIEGTQVSTTIGVEDTEASAFVIEREFSVLTMYADTAVVMSAWQRYYRQIYRDAYGRLQHAAQDIVRALDAKRKGDRGEFLFRTLLAWTQKFSYARNLAASDFEPLSSILEGGGSDCDSRAMLLSVIMNSAGYNSLMFFSPEYKHAVFGMDIAMSGAKIDVEGTEYLLGETTAPVAPGIIAKEMNDTDKWFPVIFPQ
jgi:hypothetical protein